MRTLTWRAVVVDAYDYVIPLDVLDDLTAERLHADDAPARLLVLTGAALPRETDDGTERLPRTLAALDVLYEVDLDGLGLAEIAVHTERADRVAEAMSRQAA